jgi:hypothetical protein
MRALVFLVLLAGCGAGNAQTVNATQFGVQLNLCVATGHTRAEVDACRAMVERFWCAPDAALSSNAGCAGYDGGAP